MTGAITALAIEELMGHDPQISEWFWRIDDAMQLKTYRREVMRA